MIPTLALVGRPNVGKSTLFNRMTGSRDALVADVAGLTRDRRYGRAQLADLTCSLIDTGGLLGDAGDLTPALERQAELAIDEADAVLFLVDAREGLTAGDEEIAARLRRRGQPVILVVNKMDGVNETEALAEFAPLGFSEAVYLSAAHGRGMGALARRVAALFDAAAAGAPGWSTRHDPFHTDISISFSKHCTYTLESTGHFHVEIFFFFRREIDCMGIIYFNDGIKVAGEGIIFVALLYAAKIVLITFQHCFSGHLFNILITLLAFFGFQ